MAAHDPRPLLAPEPDEEPIPVSPRKLAKLLREMEELREENLALHREIERLRPVLDKAREKNARLTDKTETLGQKLEQLQNSLAVLGTHAKTAAAVGVPSSRVFFRQPRPPPEERRPSGGQPGHKGTTRPRPVPNAPAIVLPLEACPECNTRLGNACDSSSHTQTDLPKPSLETYDVEVLRYKCPGCGRRVHAPVPEGYRGEFGPRLKAYVAELRALGIPVDKIRELLRMTYDLEVSEASVLAMERGVSESLDATYQGLWEEMRDAERTPHAQGDETPITVEGKTEQIWVGTSARATVYRIQDERSGDCAAAMWEGYEGSLTHDGLDSYNSVKGAQHQFDLVHGNRWLQKVEAQHGIEVRGFLKEEDPPKFTRAGRPPREFLEFAGGVRARWRTEVKWVEAHPNASPKARARRYARAVRSMGRFLARSWRDEDVVRIAGELRQRLEMMFTFVRIGGVSWNSNEAEREVRVAVMVREKTGGRRTENGKRVLERILTVWRTCRKRGLRFWDVVVERLGVPPSGPGRPSLGITG